jgi:hypothetical protein
MTARTTAMTRFTARSLHNQEIYATPIHQEAVRSQIRNVRRVLAMSVD